MSVGIIIRPSGYSQKKAQAPRFTPHFNRSTETYYRTAREYYSDLKKRGLEPYDPSAKDCGARKPYKPSEELKETVKAIHSQTYKGKFKPSERLVKKMENMGVKMKMNREDLKKLPSHYQSGGFA